MKLRAYFCCACTALVLLLQPPAFAAQPAGFDLQAHRGGRDARPENTLPAFAYALAIGVTTLEMDLQITADGVLVIRHNKDIPWYMAKNSWGNFLVADEQPDIRFWKRADLAGFDLGAGAMDRGNRLLVRRCRRQTGAGARHHPDQQRASCPRRASGTGRAR